MELMIIVSLLFDVIRDRMFISVLPYSTCKISIRPEFSSPKLFFYLGASSEHFPCRNAFDHRYNSRYAVRWHCLHEEMHVILIDSYLQKLHLITFLNFHAHLFYCFIHPFVKHRASVFCRKYQMVDEYRNVMAFVDIFAHINILRRKRRGIQPAEI